MKKLKLPNARGRGGFAVSKKKLKCPEDGNERCPICGVYECQEPNPRR